MDSVPRTSRNRSGSTIRLRTAGEVLACLLWFLLAGAQETLATPAPRFGSATEIVSIPPGARIEVDGKYVGRAPLWYTWGDSAHGQVERRDRGHTIVAFPSGAGQRPVARGVQGGLSGSSIPERVVLDLTIETVPTPPAPSEVHEPTAFAPKLEPVESEPQVEAFLVPWAREARRAAWGVASRGLDGLSRLTSAALEQAELARSRVAGLFQADGVTPQHREDSDAGRSAPPSHEDALGELLLTGVPGTILLGSVALLAFLVVVALGRFVWRIIAEWTVWELRFERRKPSSEGADLRRRYAPYCAALGLPPDAPFEEIRRRYRELAIRYHPDKSRSVAGAEQFKRISHAYATLERLRRGEAPDSSWSHRGTG